MARLEANFHCVFLACFPVLSDMVGELAVDWDFLSSCSQPYSPEEQFEQPVSHFSFPPSESCLESRAITSLARAAPVPKPRTTYPGKISERSSERQPALHLLEDSSLFPPQNSTSAPRVPPRRKKSAPPDFHLQVLQSSDSLFLKGLTFNSNNNNNPSEHCSETQDSSSLPLCPSESCFPAAALIASPVDDGYELLRPSALQLEAGLEAPVLQNSQQPEQLLNNDFLTGNLLNFEESFVPHQSIPSPLPISPTHALKDKKLSSPSDFSHWVTFGEDGSSNNTSQDLTELLAFKQKSWADTGLIYSFESNLFFSSLSYPTQNTMNKISPDR